MASARGFTGQDRDNPDVQAIAAFTKRLHETTDVDTLAGFYADDAVRIAPYAPGLYHGVDEIRAAFGRELKDVASRAVELDLNITTNGTMATAHGQQQVTLTMADNSVEKLSLRSHEVLRKTGDAWVVVLQHTSFMCDLKTMGPVVEQPFIKPGLMHWTVDPFPEDALPLDQVERELHEWQIDDVHAQCAEQALRYYGPGDYVTVYDSRPNPGRTVGMWDTYLAWLGQMNLKHVDDVLAEFRVFSDGQFAAVYTIQDIVATKLDGTTLVEQIRQSDCLHRIEGHWYSYIEHVSWPVDQATGKVVLNLPDHQKAAQSAPTGDEAGTAQLEKAA